MTDLDSSRPWIIAVANQKGGVGKTTTVLSLAAAIEDASGSVIVYDADPQQSAMEIADGKQLPFSVRSALTTAELASIQRVRGADTVLIDLPGNLSDTPVLGDVLAASDYAIIPTVPERPAMTPTRRTAQIIAGRELPYKILFNLVDPLRREGPVTELRKLLDGWDLPYFRSLLRRYTAHSQALLQGVSITSYRGKNWGEAVADVSRVHTELLLDLRRMS